jgi:2-hydroxy-6-oxonona-2,4-dienedioate hydrolase
MNSQKQAVIILHGWGHSASLWQGMKAKLESIGFDVIIEDLPGFGTRAGEAVDFDTPKYARWFEINFKDILEKQKVILIGHSLGGRIAIELAQNNPTWLDKLILIGTPGIYEPSQKTALIKKLGFLKQLPFINNLASNLNPEYESAKLNNLRETYQNVVGHDQKNILPSIHKPTLMIWGKEDLTVPVSIAEKMNKLISHSELKLILNSGHSPHLDNPDLLFGVINNWLKVRA